MQQYNNGQQLGLLDIITILSFLVGIYALDIGLENLRENREQSKSQNELLEYLEAHLQNQDQHLHAQDELIKELRK